MPDEHASKLHEMNPTRRFADRASDYRRYRPDYPAAAIDAVLDGLGDPARLRVGDIGAGTGIASRLLAERGAFVLAVEPNAEMRAAAEPHGRVEWHAGQAEATGLAGASLDLVVCAQAFHWFRVAAALEEFHRILAARGRLALVWNSRDRSDALTLGYIEAIHEVNGEHPAEARTFDSARVGESGLFTTPRLETYPHHQTLDRTGLIGRAISASYVPREGKAFTRLKGLLDELWQRHHDERGLITMRYVTQVYLAQRI